MLLPTLLLLALAYTSLALSPQASKLASLAKSSPSKVIRFTPSTFDEFISSPARDYSLSIVFNALKPQQNCVPCQAYQKEFNSLASQWTKKSPKSATPHYFGLVEFTENQVIFQRMALQTAPTTRYYAPTTGPEASRRTEPDEYDMRQGPNAEAIARWVVAHKPGVSYKYSPPFDYPLYLSITALCAVTAFIIERNSAKIMPFLTGRYLWATACLAFIIVMNSGYMWNQIRHPPYMTPNGGFIAQGHQNQFGVETHILSALYGLLAASVGILLFSLPKVADTVTQRIGVYVWVFIFASLHALLVSLFKTKNPSYPFNFIMW